MHVVIINEEVDKKRSEREKEEKEEKEVEKARSEKKFSAFLFFHQAVKPGGAMCGLM